MSDEYPEPPRTEWAELALLSEADDPEDYRDIHGLVKDEENWRRLQEQVVVPFDTYDDFPEEGPFDGARAEAQDMNVIFQWNADAGDWQPANTGAGPDERVPGTTYREELDVEHAAATSFASGVTCTGPSASSTMTSARRRRTLLSVRLGPARRTPLSLAREPPRRRRRWSSASPPGRRSP